MRGSSTQVLLSHRVIQLISPGLLSILDLLLCIVMALRRLPSMMLQLPPECILTHRAPWFAEG